MMRQLPGRAQRVRSITVVAALLSRRGCFRLESTQVKKTRKKNGFPSQVPNFWLISLSIAVYALFPAGLPFLASQDGGG